MGELLENLSERSFDGRSGNASEMATIEGRGNWGMGKSLGIDVFRAGGVRVGGSEFDTMLLNLL